MEISCKSEYALLALIELAVAYTSGSPLQIRQISAQQNIPDRYLEQLLATLRRGGIIRSQRGAKGGYLLARDPWRITLFEVLACLEGLDTRSIDPETALKSGKTLEGSVVCEIWQEANDAAHAVFQKYTLKDLCERRDARRQLDLMYYI